MDAGFPKNALMEKKLEDERRHRKIREECLQTVRYAMQFSSRIAGIPNP
jgi:hypothetical protein